MKDTCSTSTNTPAVMTIRVDTVEDSLVQEPTNPFLTWLAGNGIVWLNDDTLKAAGGHPAVAYTGTADALRDMLNAWFNIGPSDAQELFGVPFGPVTTPSVGWGSSPVYIC